MRIDVALTPAEPPAPAGERERLVAAVDEALRELGAAGASGTTVQNALAALERCGPFFAGLPEDRLAEPEQLKELKVKRATVKAMRTPVFDELEEAYSSYATLCETAKATRHHAMLGRLLEMFAARYAELKEARSALDFDDLELRARDLLRDDGPLRVETRARFAEVMVDEFQDTNPLQVEVIDLIARDNLFAVGDERQSIYGFRHADVELFRERSAAAAEAGRATSLTTNFRTRPAVLAVLNRAFGEVWGERFEPLGAGVGDDPSGDPAVELLIVDAYKKRWDDALGGEAGARAAFGAGTGETAWRMAEARLVADRIAELAGPERGYGFGDVAILLRAATDMALYERALVERGIPAYSHGGRGFSEAQQVGDLRAYLAALANPRDEAALTAVLPSPLAGASLDALALLHLRARALSRDLWWTLEQAFGGDGSNGLADALPESDRDALAAFAERFARQRAAAPRLSLESLIERAVSESGYDRTVLAMPGGERRLANVRKLMRLARLFEAGQGRDLRRFIDHLDERELLRAHEGEAPVEGEARTPAVRLMTIHAAKGLEFPVVCVADLGRPARGGEDEGLQVAADGRVGLRLASLSGERSDALEWTRLKEEQAERAEQEERRILYVAMTRAQSRLILSGATDTERWPDAKPLERPLDWVWRAVAPGAKDLLDGTYRGVDSGVACTKLSPGTLDDVLGPAARRPEPEGPAADEPWEPPPRPELAEVPAARPLPVGRLSYSSLESYRRCGYRFYVERVAGLRPRDLGAAPAAAPPAANGDGQLVLDLAAARPPRTAEAITPLLRGSIVHELLERLDMRAPEVPGDDAIAERVRAHGAAAGPEDVADIAGLIGGFAGSELRARIAAGGPVRTELPFAFDLTPAGGAPVTLNGVVDVHVEEPDGVLIVDYKTDPLLGEDPEVLVERAYTTQRLVYALAALRAGAPRVEVVYSFLEAPARPVAAEYGPDDVPALEARILELADGVLAGRFVPTDAPHRELCWTCPARESLCVHGPERTLSEPPTPSLRSP
jgi:ATP-dependent exoDNAse (exonuclease V) beta subunit